MVKVLSKVLAVAMVVSSGWVALDASAAEAVVSTHWPLSGGGGWDYLTADAAAAKVYVSRGDHVDVVDSTTGQVVATIKDTSGVHGIALAPELNLGFTSNGRSNSVTVFDLKTSARIKDVALDAQNPDAILYDASTQHVFTFNGRSKDVTVVDAKTGVVKGTIPMPGKPEFAQSDEHGAVYVNIETEPGQLVKINAKTLTVEATWTLAGCNSPTGLALDRQRGRLFSVCDDKAMVVTDAHNGKIVATVAIGDGPDAVAYDAQTQRIFVSNGEGTLSVVAQKDANHYAPVQTLTTERGARTLALDEATGKVFAITAQFAPGEPTATNPKPRPQVVPGTVHLLVIKTR